MKIKYTRYDLKRKNKDNTFFIMLIIFVLIIALILGSIFSNLFIKNSIEKDSVPKDGTKTEKAAKVNNSKVTVDYKNKAVKYIVIQGGMYKNDQYASAEEKKLKSYGNPFVVKDGENKRVLLGVYNTEYGEKLIKTLSEKKVANSTMNFTINSRQECDGQISAIISAYIEILTKLSQNGVKAIKTDEFKKWCSKLDKVNKDDKNIKILENLKSHVSKMDKEINRDKVPKCYVYIFNLLKQYSQNNN